MSIDHLLEGLAGAQPVLVYLVVAGLVLLESLGIPVPGETALLVGATMATHPLAAVRPWGIAVAGLTGAVVGDSVGYLVGARVGPPLLDRLSRRFPRRFTPDHLAYLRHLMDRYGVPVVAAGRFLPLLRMLAGPTAGALRMPYPRFLAANASGALVWSFGLVGIVYLLGSAVQARFAGAAWVVLGVVVVVGAVASRVVNAGFQRRVQAYAHRARPDPAGEGSQQR